MGRLSVRVQPGARRTDFAGWYGELPKIAVAAPPVEGAANGAVVNTVIGVSLVTPLYAMLGVGIGVLVLKQTGAVTGALLWFLIGRAPLRNRPVTRVVAPDDDPNFLQSIRRDEEAAERIRRLEQELAELDDDPPASAKD